MNIKSPEIVDSYDVGVFGLGYEKRSVFALETIEASFQYKCAIGYDVNNNEHSYQENKKLFMRDGFKLSEVGVKNLGSALSDILPPNILSDAARVLVDITAMSRGRLATVLWYILNNISENCAVDVVYSPSEFVSPPSTTTPIKKIEEIIEPLSGLMGDISLQTSLVLGLGYEKNKALGVYSYLEPDELYLLLPNSRELKFKESVEENNQFLIASAAEYSIFDYDVSDTNETYRILKDLIVSLLRTSRPIFLPLGPKILAAIGVVLGYELRPYLPVWRASSEHAEEPKERLSTGELVIFSISK